MCRGNQINQPENLDLPEVPDLLDSPDKLENNKQIKNDTQDNPLLLVRWKTDARISPEMHRELEEVSS